MSDLEMFEYYFKEVDLLSFNQIFNDFCDYIIIRFLLEE